jgi:GT2 family glycosyltransferase
MKASLISLNLNGAGFLENFLASVHVEIGGYPEMEMILLDNGSSDNSVSLVTNRFPWVRIIPSNRNLGFTRGCQKAAEQSDADTLIFLNNDMVLEPGFVDEILKPFEQENPPGAVAGLVLNDTGTFIDYAGGEVNLFGWGFQKHHTDPLFKIEELYFDQKYIDQFFPCGGALAIKRQTWIESGGFDKDYFAFFEDVDLGWRLNLMGLKTTLALNARVKHVHHGTAAAMPIALRSFLLERNALMTIIKNYDDRNLNFILPWAIAFTNTRALIESDVHLVDVFRGRWAEDVFGDEPQSVAEDILDDIQNLKRVGIRTAKNIAKKDPLTRKYPIRSLALEDVFLNWDNLMKSRLRVQNLRKVKDEDVLSMITQKYRTVLGHEREKLLMEDFQKNVQL